MVGRRSVGGLRGRWLDAADRESKYRNWRMWHRRAVPGGGGLGRPSWAVVPKKKKRKKRKEEEEKEETEGEGRRRRRIRR